MKIAIYGSEDGLRVLALNERELEDFLDDPYSYAGIKSFITDEQEAQSVLEDSECLLESSNEDRALLLDAKVLRVSPVTRRWTIEH